MKFVLSCCFSCFFFIITTAQSFTISGQIKDSGTGKPLAGATVFIDKTSYVTYTDSTGKFTFPYQAGVSARVLCYKNEYHTAEYFIEKLNKNYVVGFNLTPEKTSDNLLDSVINKNNDQWLLTFLKQFLGQSNNAYACEVVNTKALRYSFSKEKNILNVNAVEPLMIINENTGFMITYLLDQCVLDFKNNFSVWDGAIWFKPLTSKSSLTNESWNLNREKTYGGSLLHFFRSLLAGNFVKDGFDIAIFKRYYEGEKNYGAFLPYADNTGVEEVTDGKGNSKKLKFADVKVKSSNIKDSLIQYDAANGQYYLSFGQNIVRVGYKPGLMYASYYLHAKESFSKLLMGEYPFSIILSMENDKVYIEKNGNCLNENDLLLQGYWRWLRVADMLPLNYEKN